MYLLVVYNLHNIFYEYSFVLKFITGLSINLMLVHIITRQYSEKIVRDV